MECTDLPSSSAAKSNKVLMTRPKTGRCGVGFGHTPSAHFAPALRLGCFSFFYIPFRHCEEGAGATDVAIQASLATLRVDCHTLLALLPKLAMTKDISNIQYYIFSIYFVTSFWYSRAYRKVIISFLAAHVNPELMHMAMRYSLLGRVSSE
jgi:hypothetical protein